jgi:hypothetical protein
MTVQLVFYGGLEGRYGRDAVVMIAVVNTWRWLSSVAE